MANTIIVLTDPALAEGFLADAAAAGVEIEPFEGLPRHFLAPGLHPDDFSLKSHPAIELIELDGASDLKPAAQAVSLNQDGTGAGGWPAARVIRRNNPWNDVSRPHPWSSTFECVRTGAGVDIYMIDAGCEYTHAEFGGRVSQFWAVNDTAGNAAAADGSNHGTFCMSQALGRTVGIAREAQGHSFKFNTSGSGAGDSKALAALGAILTQYQRNAADDRPAVMFWSWSGFGSAINTAVADLINAGLVCCFPAANDLTDLGTIVSRPAESDADAIICGGINMRDAPYYAASSGTNWGDEVDILAPAQNNLGARLASEGGDLRTGNGTSFATPIVAGVVACMLQGYKRLTTRAEVQALKAKLIANATTGKRTLQQQVPELPDAIVYLDPFVPFEVIEGLTPRTP